MSANNAVRLFPKREMRVRRKNNYAMIVSELRRPYDERSRVAQHVGAYDGAGRIIVGAYAALVGAASEGKNVG
jgi:hypothetical protein